MLGIIEAIASEDSRILTISLPNMVNDAVTALSVCGLSLIKTNLDYHPVETIDCVNRINKILASLLDTLLNDFAKYSE